MSKLVINACIWWKKLNFIFFFSCPYFRVLPGNRGGPFSTPKGLFARRASYSWAFAGCIIFLPCLFCGQEFSIFFLFFATDSLRCWLWLAFSDSLVQQTFQNKKMFWTNFTASRRFAGWASRASTPLRWLLVFSICARALEIPTKGVGYFEGKIEGWRKE